MNHTYIFKSTQITKKSHFEDGRTLRICTVQIYIYIYIYMCIYIYIFPKQNVLLLAAMNFLLSYLSTIIGGENSKSKGQLAARIIFFYHPFLSSSLEVINQILLCFKTVKRSWSIWLKKKRKFQGYAKKFSISKWSLTVV